MSELFNKQVNAQKEFDKIFPGFTQAAASPRKKCAMKMKETNKQTRKNDTCKNAIDGKKPFIMSIPKTGNNNLHELRKTIVDTMKVLFV